MTNEFHINDIGTVFEITVNDGTTAVDLSSATVKSFIFKKPDQTVVTKTASFKNTGTDGILKYTTVSGDLDVTGSWTVQVYVELPTGKWHSSTQMFTVFGNLS